MNPDNSARKTNNHDLTQGKEWKVIIRFAWPLLIGNLLLQLYNVADSVIVGHFLGKEALAAVSASFFIYYFIISLVIGLGSGTTVVVSQLYGAREFDRVQQAFSSFFIVMLIAGIFLSVGGIIFAEEIFRLTNTPEDVLPEAVRYFRIYIGGTFLFVTFNSIISILRGIGESFRPMIFILISALLNIGLDFLFILIFKWEIEGAARATVVAQGIAMCVSLIYVNDKHPLLSIKKKDMLFKWDLFYKSMRIGIPTSVQQCAIAIGLIALLSIVNDFGTDTLTAYGAAGKIDTIFTQAILTLSGAVAAFTGQNIGARQMNRIKTGMRFSMFINFWTAVFVFTIIYWGGEGLMKAFTSDASVIKIGKEYLLVLAIFFPIHGALNILNGILRGAGATFFTMMTSIFSLWLIRIPLAWYLSNHWGRAGIWWAIGISISIGFIITYIYYKTGYWKKSIIPNISQKE